MRRALRKRRVFDFVPSYLKFNLARAIELSETADFYAQFCIETLCKRATSAAHLTNFSFEFLYEIFTDDASLFYLNNGAKKSKMTKNSNQGVLP